jgi:NAD+ synthase
VKVTRKNFGRDRRYPIVNRFRDQGLVAHRNDEALARAMGKPRTGPVDV